MLNLNNETTKRVFFAIALVSIFIPLFITTRYAGEPGRIISAVAYSFLGMYVIYEIMISLQVKMVIAIVATTCVPLFFILPYEEFISIITLNEAVNYLSILAKRAISSWQGWTLALMLSFVPLTLQGQRGATISYGVRQAIITSMFILIPTFAKLIWVFNIKGIEIIAFFILISTISDTGGYFGGKFFGHKWFQGRKLTPRLSPKKTYAGFVIGTVPAIIFAILYGYFMHIWKDFGNKELLVAIIFGILLSLVSPLGDLYFSGIKRSIGIKDFSNAIPGHGGLMDRLDAISFVFVTSGFLLLFVFN